MHRMLKTTFVDNAKGGTQTFSDFLDSDIGKFWLSIVSFQVAQVIQPKTWRKFSELSTKTGEVSFLR
jgi:hypothetical protein